MLNGMRVPKACTCAQPSLQKIPFLLNNKIVEPFHVLSKQIQKFGSKKQKNQNKKIELSLLTTDGDSCDIHWKIDQNSFKRERKKVSQQLVSTIIIFPNPSLKVPVRLFDFSLKKYRPQKIALLLKKR